MKAKITVNKAKQAKKEDIFTAGNVVFSENSGEIIFITNNASYSEGYFSGVDIVNKHFTDSWIKECFVQWHGTMTISTEA